MAMKLFSGNKDPRRNPAKTLPAPENREVVENSDLVSDPSHHDPVKENVIHSTEEPQSQTGSGGPMGETLGLPPRGKALSDPVPPEAALRWDRYRDFTFLGQGGMGLVFAAFDRQLRRRVAVKFLNKLEPDRVRRFIQEARAQARVEHEHVAKIYDSGDVAGQPYIAMQLIEGQTLDKAAADMSLEQKLAIMKKVAEGVHAAHVAGLIHRDLKPGNIILDSDQNPHVLDFGLALLEESASLTADGTVLGTPSYMAPEQARGEVKVLDRRTDVYGLGATLYRLVTGRAPFEGPNQAAVLVNILEKTPVNPKDLIHNLPTDLETIIFKCMQKEAQARYGSAKALSQDLDRYLQGEPILARPTTFWYRLRKRMRKNRTLVRMAFIAALLVLLTLSWGLRTAWHASVRENLAGKLNREVGEIEALARYSHLTRRHDIRPDRQRLQQKMAAISTMGQEAGSLGRGPTNYALGRGYLALSELDSARLHLDKAWGEGFRGPEVAYALGLAYGGLFQRHLSQLYLIEDGELRQRRRAELERTFRDPAVEFMGQTTSGEAVSPNYLHALIAFYQLNYQQAATLVAMVSEKMPWFYEAKKLEADIYRDWAAQKSAAGETDSAQQLFDKARHSYRAAGEVGQSDPTIYKDQAKALLQMMTSEVFSGGKVAPLLEEGLRIIESGLVVLPDDVEALLLASRLHLKMARQKLLADEDPTVLLERASGLAVRAGDVAENSSAVYLMLGEIYWRQAQWLARNKQNARAKTDAVLEVLEKVAPSHRDHHYFNLLGAAAKNLATWTNRSGEPACELHDRAIEAFRGVIALRPDKISGYNNLSGSLMARSGQESCPGEALDQLREAEQALEMALKLNPKHPVLHYQLGRTNMRMARGGRPQSPFLDQTYAEKALYHYEQALAINPKLGPIYNAAGLGYVALARHAWDHGGQPTRFFQKAFALYGKGLQVTPNSRLLQQNMAWAFYYQGKFLCRSNQTPTADLAQALAWSQKALDQGESLDALLCLGSAYRMKAEYAILQNQNPDLLIRQASQYFKQILAINSQFSEAFRSLGRLHTLSARWLMQEGLNPEPAFNRAWEELAQARSKGQGQLAPMMAAAELVLWRGIGEGEAQGQGADLKQGFTWVDVVLKEEPGHAEARALRACLMGLEARAKEGSLNASAHNLKLALSHNPNLRHYWEPIFSSITGLKH